MFFTNSLYIRKSYTIFFYEKVVKWCKLYSSMYYSEKDAIAHMVGIGRDTLENHLHCLSVLRNKCAHAARMYNTDFNPPAKFTTSFLRKHPEIKNNSLFAYTLVLLKRLPDESSKNL